MLPRPFLRRSLSPLVFMIAGVMLTSCGGGAELDDGGEAGAAVTNETVDRTSADSGASDGTSLLQIDVPIPAEQRFYEVTSPPPHWPEFIGVPESLDTSQGFFVDQPTPTGRSLSATLLHEEGDSFGSEALEQILAMGFEPVLDNESGSGRFVILRSGEEEVQITLGPESTTISISG